MLAYRVSLKNDRGDTFSIRVECYIERDSYAVALEKVSQDPYHVKNGPWEVTASTRCY